MSITGPITCTTRPTAAYCSAMPCSSNSLPEFVTTGWRFPVNFLLSAVVSKSLPASSRPFRKPSLVRLCQTQPALLEVHGSPIYPSARRTRRPAHNLDDFLGDGRLPDLVHMQCQGIDYLARILRGGFHRRHARRVLRRRGLQHDAQNLGFHVARQ